MRTIVIKNQSGVQKTYAGKVMEDTEEYTIQDHEVNKFQTSSLLLDDITAGNADISNGVSYFANANKAIAYLQATEQIWDPIPKTDDGKPIFLNAQFPGDVSLGWTGRGDDVSSPPFKRWEGVFMKVTKSVVGSDSSTLQFAEPIYLAGGTVFYTGAEYGDWLRFYAHADATPATNTPGTGNCDKQDVGGYNRFIENSGSTGDWTVDLQTAVVIPSATQTGSWDWNDTTNRPVVNTTGDGKFNLLDIPISNLVENLPCLLALGNNMQWNFSIQGKAKKFMPHWKLTFEVHKVATDAIDLKAVGNLHFGRENTATGGSIV